MIAVIKRQHVSSFSGTREMALISSADWVQLGSRYPAYFTSESGDAQDRTRYVNCPDADYGRSRGHGYVTRDFGAKCWERGPNNDPSYSHLVWVPAELVTCPRVLGEKTAINGTRLVFVSREDYDRMRPEPEVRLGYRAMDGAKVNGPDAAGTVMGRRWRESLLEADRFVLIREEDLRPMGSVPPRVYSDRVPLGHLSHEWEAVVIGTIGEYRAWCAQYGHPKLPPHVHECRREGDQVASDVERARSRVVGGDLATMIRYGRDTQTSHAIWEGAWRDLAPYSVLAWLEAKGTIASQPVASQPSCVGPGVCPCLGCVADRETLAGHLVDATRAHDRGAVFVWSSQESRDAASAAWTAEVSRRLEERRRLASPPTGVEGDHPLDLVGCDVRGEGDR